MLRYPQKIKAIEPDNADIRLLQQLVEQRRQLVEDKRRFVNRIINTLKQYYPQPLEWFSHRGSLLLCELIIRWPSLQQLKRARRDTIRNFLNAKGGRAMALTEQRVASIDNAIPLTTDPSVIEANALMATALATQIKVVSEIIKTYDERIEALFDTLPDAELFKSLPGMGPCMGPRMLAALGDNRDRFNSAEEIQNYAGIAPVTERSGQKSWFTGDGSVPSSSGKPLLNGLPRRLIHHTGPDCIIRASERRANLISLRSGHWRSNG